MSIELQALEEIKNHKIKVDVNIKYDNGYETQHRFETIRDMFPKQFAIIETALKDSEELDNALNDIFEKFGINRRKDLLKKLKALEIIKDKKVNLEYLKCCENYKQYKTICSYWNEIDKEDFDLLKEVLL